MRLLILFILAGFFSPLHAETFISSPQTLSKDNETYVLTQNITADGTAFTIDGDNITLNLNAYIITYNNNSEGAGIVIRGTNNEVKNGDIIQGADRSATSPAVRLTGTDHTVSYLAIKVNPDVNYGEFGAGIELLSSRSTIRYVYIENNGTTSDTSYSPRGIHADHRTTAGFTINDNIIVNSHLGINLVFVGLNTAAPEKSRVFNNFIQHVRSPGTKAPYGIQLAKTRNVDVYSNQIISDDGRGIMCDGFGQGVARGTDFINVYNNKIDVEYRAVASGGAYVENNVYGIRNRYSSGNNSFRDNTIMVNNRVGGVTTGLYIGSDSADALMTNLSATNNKIIVRNGYTGASANASAVRYSFAQDLSATGNTYLASNLTLTDWTFGIDDLILSGNTPFSIAPYTPATPDGLILRKFFDNYVLSWDDNNEAQTFEYVLYRDGVQIDMSTRGGTFFVDNNAVGDHTYTVVAKNLNGDLSSQSSLISTSDAESGWSILTLRPLPPQNVQLN